MLCVSASNFVQVLRTINSSSWSGAEHRRNVHLINNVEQKNRLPSKCRCSAQHKKITRTNFQRILRLQQSALLVLFVSLIIYEVACAAPSPTPGYYCSSELADALTKTCGTRGTQAVTHPSRRPTRAAPHVDIIDKCCRHSCYMKQLARFCGGKRLLTPEEHHMKRIISSMKINRMRIHPNRSRYLSTAERVGRMTVRTFWINYAASYPRTTYNSIVSNMARIRQQPTTTRQRPRTTPSGK